MRRGGWTPWQRWWPGGGCPHNRGRVILLLTAVEQKGISHDEAEHRRNRDSKRRRACRLSGGLQGRTRALRLRAGAYGCSSGAVRGSVPVDGARGHRDAGARKGQGAVFLEDRPRRGHGDLVSPAGVRPLVGYLTRAGAITGQGFAVPEGAARPLLERYRRYLETERGLTAKTVERYVEVGCRLAAALERGGAVDWQRVRARDV